MNRLLSEEWISQLYVPDSLTWVSLATLGAPGGLLDFGDLASDPGFAGLGEVLGLPVVNPAEVRRDWESRGRPLEQRPVTGDWTILFEYPMGSALLVPDEAYPVPRLMLFTVPDDRDGLRVAVLDVEDGLVTRVEFRRRRCRRDPSTGVCTGHCRRNGICDWQYYAGGGPITGKCECIPQV